MDLLDTGQSTQMNESGLDMSVEAETARATGMLHLSYRFLDVVPPVIFRMTGLARLDLSWNELDAIPTAVSQLVNLQQLWLNDNPLVTVPPEIEQCTRLEVLDIRRTRVRKLPREIGRLKRLYEISLAGTTLKPKQNQAFQAGHTDGLVWHLRRRDTLKIFKIQLERDLRDGIYREIADGEMATEQIKALVKAAFHEFTEYDEIKNLIRNADRLFPADLDHANASDIRTVFVRLKRENEVKKLAAELELKLRCIYFDRIRPDRVEGIVNSIYHEITELEDIVFLIRHAPEIFPEHAKDIDAMQVHTDMVALQDRLAAERAAAVKALDLALRSIYSHVDPDEVTKVAEAVATKFKKIEELKELTADAVVYFPSEIESARPNRIRQKFKEAQESALGVNEEMN